ncbi:mannose-ethanolamine phosphotransferase gpi13 [Terramyces sp. JEL0728]|nr:mannose-ethanolamine phosphotransferase gpi13 [Terramyces sp. JEL0728]
MEKNLKADLSVPIIPPFQQKEAVKPIEMKAPTVQNFEIAAASLMGPVVPEFTLVPPRSVKADSNMVKVPKPAVAPVENLVRPVPTRPVAIKPTSSVAAKPKSKSPPKEKSRATFFISESQSSHSTIGSYRSNYSDDEDSDLESDISGDSYVEAPTLFLKNCRSNLPIKRASLLSVAIQRQAFRRSQSHNTHMDTLPQDIPQPIYSQDIDISPSLKENLAWDHARPFNTTAKMEVGRHIDSTPISMGLYLFKEGFLLSRLELHTKSTLPSLPTRYNKTLLVMIDALRFDFIKYEPELKTNIPHYINKVPVIHEMLTTQPRNSLLFRGLADPPTTTLQRLMAIVTGALPTLVDAGSNFEGASLKEDNILEKILKRNQRVVSLGDDTWDKLFPSGFNESHFYPSFEVWDLHSLDKGVLSHLWPMLDKPDHDWGFFIAHFLGVDHAGHRYGPGHYQMGDKLAQMDGVLRKLFDKVHKDTLVIVMGDHGMDQKGDHGGDSDPEMDAALFFYSKKPLIAGTKSYDDSLKQIVQGTKELDDGYEKFSEWKNYRTVQQIDLVPTLSLLMGLNIPFGNLGSIIPEFFTDSDLHSLLDAVRLNAQQMDTYLNAYSTLRKDAKQAFSKSRNLYKKAKEIDGGGDKKSMVASYLAYTHFLRHTLLIARNIWSRFEPTLMVMGIVILVMSFLSSITMYFKNLEAKKPLIIGGFSSIIGLFSPIRSFFYPGHDLDSLTIKASHEMLFFAALSFSIAQFFHLKSIHFDLLSKYSLLGIVVVVLYASCVGSDSFTIFEDFTILHFVQFIHVAMLYMSFNLKSKKVVMQRQILVCAVIARLVSFVTLCRPDQGPYCVATFNASPTKSISAVWSPLVLILLNIIIVYDVRKTKKSRQFANIATLSIASVTIYWTLDTFEAHNLLPSTFIKNIFVYIYWPTIAYLFYTTPKTGQNMLVLYYVFLSMFQKPMGGVVLSLGYIYFLSLKAIQRHWPLNYLIYPQGFLIGQLIFYSTGHQNTLPSVQYDVGFIGLSSANYVLSPIFISLNTFAGPIFGSVATNNWKILRMISGTALTTTVIFTCVFSRHSQAFRVWGPKFLFFAAGHTFSGFLNILNGFVEVEDQSEVDLKNE